MCGDGGDHRATTKPLTGPQTPHSQRSQQGKTAEMEGGVWPTAAFDFL